MLQIHNLQQIDSLLGYLLNKPSGSVITESELVPRNEAVAAKHTNTKTSGTAPHQAEPVQNEAVAAKPTNKKTSGTATLQSAPVVIEAVAAKPTNTKTSGTAPRQAEPVQNEAVAAKPTNKKPVALLHFNQHQ